MSGRKSFSIHSDKVTEGKRFETVFFEEAVLLPTCKVVDKMP
jgi:hypothetical protein